MANTKFKNNLEITNGTLLIGLLGTGTSINTLGIDSNGVVVSGDSSDTYVTGGNYSIDGLTLDRNDGESVTVTGLTDTNFANTDLTFDFSREHNITEDYYLQITSDGGSFNEAYLSMSGSLTNPSSPNPGVLFGYGENFYQAGVDFSRLIAINNEIKGLNYLNMVADSIANIGSGINSDILIGNNNNDTQQTNQFRNTRPTIISSKNSIILSGISNSAIIGGEGVTARESNTAYVVNPVIKKTNTIPSATTDTIGEAGSITWDDEYFYWKTDSGWLRVSGTSF